MTRPNPHPTHLEAVAHAAASVVNGGQRMSEARRITVTSEDPRWQECDREVMVAVWHNKYQPTALPISRQEAATLRGLLEDFLRSWP